MVTARFANEYELQKVVLRCHNVLWERHGFDPAQAFDEFSKLLFVKLYDEMTIAGARTAIQRGEQPEQFAARIRWLFDQANETPGFDSIFTDNAINLDNLAIYEVFRALQHYSLMDTTSQVQGADVKGTIYESILGNTFRGELGQFFTHRSIVAFMVRFVGIDAEKVVYDPSCGSGGFLIMCAKIIREQTQRAQPNLPPQEMERILKEYSRRCLIGTEINERTARVARLNLLMHGLDYSNIFTVNALKTEESTNERLKALVGENTVDVVFANPPFAGYEKDPAVLSKFELGQNGRGRVSSVTREVLFIERIIQVLKNGGVAGIVIPQGIFTNRNLAHVRDYIRRHTQILAVIELPDWAFIPSGTSVRGSLLFIRKLAQVPEDYNIFMKRVEHIGFTSTGRPDDRNDLPQTIAEYQQQDTRYLVSINELKDRIDAKFYIPEHRHIISLFHHNPKHKLVKLSDIGSFYTEKVNPRFTSGEIRLVETSCVDPVTLTISPKHIKGQDSNYTSLKRLRAGDILISRRRAYRGAIVVVPPELDGALAIPEFSVLRLHEGYDPDYVAEILRSPQFLQLMTIYSTGEMSGRIAEKDLRRLSIPLPEDHQRYGDAFKAHRQRIEELRHSIAAEENQIIELASSLIEGR
ncbi:MAG: N-6 DNA methylase [Anaerolineae bacterium]|jgi:type I restriction enzyme M protein|nr:N-6 DNA methylase [Anaerolineae bacterium]MDH7473724.1 N-6 DNA methylase [Anaerolineae bacterium]